MQDKKAGQSHRGGQFAQGQSAQERCDRARPSHESPERQADRPAQYPAEPLKTETSRTAVPFGNRLALELSAHIGLTEGLRRDERFLCNDWGDQLAPWGLQRAMRTARDKVPGPVLT